MKQMHKDEHEYYHKLMYILTTSIEPKFTKGCVEHRDKGMLWNMSDEDLDKNINEELSDLIVYWAEKQRRIRERNT